MEKAKQAQETIIETVKTIGNYAESAANDTAVFTASRVDGQVQIAAAGSPIALTKLLAEAINADPKLEQIVRSAVKAAPMLDLMNMLSEDDGEVCTCARCVAKREAVAKNPNVN